MSGIPLLASASAAMAAQRSALDVAARNVAAAQASSPEHPYHRLVARFTFGPPAEPVSFVRDVGTRDDEGDEADGRFEDDAGAPESRTVKFAGTAQSRAPADTLTELIGVLDAQRAYEADATMFDVAKRLAERTLDVERA